MQRHVTRRHCAAALASAVIGIGGFVPRVDAVNIIMVYNTAASAEPVGDPTGALLTSLMARVESVYQDIFEDTHTLTINFWYENQDPGTLAVHSLVSQSGGRETEADIRFDPTADGNNWFWDPTPADNTEFNMGQTLWRDLSAATQGDFYNPGASIPQTFETGFTGAGNGSNPNTAGNTDALSVAFHEVGHALGMSAANNSTVAETGDDDYDYDAVNVFGRTLAVEVADGSNIAHLDNSNALMNPSVGTNLRRLPSHTDLFAMAAVHNYVDLDIPRREFYGGTNWNLDSNWSGNTVPAGADEVFVRASGPAGEIRTANLTANGSAGTLNISEASNVDTGAFQLTVGTVVVDGLDSDMIVGAGGTLTATRVTVQNSAQLLMQGGVMSVATLTNNAEVQNDSGVSTINVSASFVNSGQLDVLGTSLRLATTSATGVFNLDGVGTSPLFIEPGDVNVTVGDLTVDGAQTDEFNGVLNIGNSRTATFLDPWTVGGVSGTIILGTDGVVNLNGGTTSATAATLAGALVTIEGDVNVGTTNYGQISAPVSFVAGATVVVNGTLDLAGATGFAGGSYTGTGVISQDGNATVTANTTIDVATYDWDGSVAGTNTTLNPGVTLVLNSTVLEDDPNTGHDGQITVNSSTLTVNTPGGWEANGTIMLNNAAGAAQIFGQPLALVGANVDSTGGPNQIHANVSFAGINTVSVAASNLQLGGLGGLAGGVLNKTGPAQLNVLGAQNHAAGAIVNVQAGQLLMATNAGGGGPNLTVNLTGGSSFTTSSNVQRLAALNIGAASLMRTTGPGDAQVLRTTAFSIAGGPVPTGRLDITNDSMIMDYAGASPLVTTFEQIRAAYNGGLWNGQGITSGSANANQFAVGYAEASGIFVAFPATFAGQSVDNTTLLLTFTRYGDTNLDRTVNLTDFNRLAANFGQAGRFWWQGDFNYNNTVNLQDFNLLAGNFGLSAGADGVVDPNDWAALAAAIPEPTGAGASLAGLAVLGARRRRRRVSLG